MTVRPRILVAGVGNIFRGDDGFGVEVARRLAEAGLPDWVQAADFGIKSVHLAFELLDAGYDTTILVDAMTRGGAPGTVYLVEPDLAAVPADAATAGGSADAHGLSAEAVFALLRSFGGQPGRVLVVGCEPAHTGDQMGLSGPVEAAVGQAVALIRELVAREAPGHEVPTRSVPAREAPG